MIIQNIIESHEMVFDHSVIAGPNVYEIPKNIVVKNDAKAHRNTFDLFNFTTWEFFIFSVYDHKLTNLLCYFLVHTQNQHFQQYV